MKYWRRQKNLEWAELSGIPTDLTDGKITWNEVIDKPLAFPPVPHVHTPETYNTTTSIGQSLVNLIGGTQSGRLERAITNGHYVIFVQSNDSGDCFAVVTATGADSSIPSLVALRVVRGGDVFIGRTLVCPNIPSTPSGLQTGGFYKDNNGFVKVV